MRGQEDRGEGMVSHVRLEDRVPADHPLQEVRRLTDEVLAALGGRFEAMYSGMGRPTIAPEMLLRATLLQAFFSVMVTPEACFQHDAPTHGVDRLQPALSLVCRPADRRGCLASDSVQPQPRPPDEGGCGAGIPRGVDGSGAGLGAAVLRAFRWRGPSVLGRWHAVRR